MDKASAVKMLCAELSKPQIVYLCEKNKLESTGTKADLCIKVIMRHEPIDFRMVYATIKRVKEEFPNGQ